VTNSPSAGERIASFLAGYPSRLRAVKPLVFLQAYIDDSVSQSGDGRLFLAGYINSTENWMRFSDAWERELHYPKSVDYLHMVEANGLRGQFRGWGRRQRDKKVSRFAEVIRRYRPESFHWSIDRSDFLELIEPYAPRGLSSLHYVGTFGVVAMVTRYLASQKVEANVDFIFDEQADVSADIPLFFDYMTRSIPKAARKMINGAPIFRNDREMLPLQAADMLAWHLRRQHEHGDVADKLDALMWDGGGHLVVHANRPALERIGR
jgi:Protein of unknown function (DUF3800)